MSVYDEYYQDENLFGEPYPELIEYFRSIDRKKIILDLGCGQGRNLIPLAKIGFSLIGLDTSSVGIKQIERTASNDNLKFKCIVGDIYSYDAYENIDIVLLDSMFHFYKKDLNKERELIINIIKKIKRGTFVVFCIQDTGKKFNILKDTITYTESETKELLNKKIEHSFYDKETNTIIITKYRLYVIEKRD